MYAELSGGTDWRAGARTNPEGRCRTRTEGTAPSFLCTRSAAGLPDGGTGGSPGDREFEIVWDIWGRQVEPLGATMPYMISIGAPDRAQPFRQQPMWEQWLVALG